MLAAAAVSGCAGNGSGLDSNGNPLTPGGGSGSGPLEANFKSIQDNIFTPICTKCHIGAGAPEGLQLDEAHSYALLVGVASAEQPAVMRVAPGSPDNSYIIRKLQNTAGISGGQMPLGGPYLQQSTIDVIRQWITDGAQPPAAAMTVDAAAKAVQRFGVTTTSPDNGSIVSIAVPGIVVAFNGGIDSNLINETTVGVTKVEGQSEAPVSAVIAVAKGNPAAIVITPQAPLTNGTYRVILHGALANTDAQALGSDYTFTFTVDTLQ